MGYQQLTRRQLALETDLADAMTDDGQALFATRFNQCLEAPGQQVVIDFNEVITVGPGNPGDGACMSARPGERNAVPCPSMTRAPGGVGRFLPTLTC